MADKRKYMVACYGSIANNATLYMTHSRDEKPEQGCGFDTYPLIATRECLFALFSKAKAQKVALDWANNPGSHDGSRYRAVLEDTVKRNNRVKKPR